ncbi:MAG: hypothetical protein JWP52_1889 [Rhizobacter sp.]|jgi:hypothetical protein|nr:hypothetical protein [Rhizobacter sp.]
MNQWIDSFLRAMAYCLHPKVILLSLLPVLIAGGAALGLGYFFWESAIDGVRDTLSNWELLDTLFGWLASVGATGLRSLLAPLIVVALAVPVVVVVTLVLVAVLMTPALVNLVSARRFPLLERKRGAALWQSVMWSLSCTLLALLALIVSLPLWLVFPLVLILPPLIWGWLTYRVMSFDALSEHASKDERQALMKRHRLPLLGIGIVCGYLGAAPSLVWAFSAITLVLAPLLIVVSVWLYTLVFAFSSLWFAHYCLKALQTLRGEQEVPAMVVPGADYPVSDESAVRTVSGLPERPLWPPQPRE